MVHTPRLKLTTKQAEDVNNLQETQIANRHVIDMYSTSLIVKEMHRKTMRFHLSSIRLVNKSLVMPSVHKIMGKQAPSYTSPGSINRFSSPGGQFSNVCQHFECLFSVTQQFYCQKFALGIYWQNYAEVMYKDVHCNIVGNNKKTGKNLDIHQQGIS